MSDFEKELGWDDEIEKESDFVLLPEGDYNFTVSAFERGRHEGSEKLPPCNKAIISLHIESNEVNTTIKHNLFLHTKTEGMLSAFFCAIGQKKHGEKLKMNWTAVVGAKGRCKVGIRNWTSKNNELMQSNEIKKFYDPEETKPTETSVNSQAGVFTPGKF